MIKGLGTKIQSLKTMDTLRKSYEHGGRERCASALRARLASAMAQLTEMAGRDGAAPQFAAGCLADTAATLQGSGSGSGGDGDGGSGGGSARTSTTAYQLRLSTWLKDAKARAKVLRGQVQKWRDKYHATQVALAARHESLARITQRLAEAQSGSREEASANASLMEDEDDLRAEIKVLQGALARCDQLGKNVAQQLDDLALDIRCVCPCCWQPSVCPQRSHVVRVRVCECRSGVEHVQLLALQRDELVRALEHVNHGGQPTEHILKLANIDSAHAARPTAQDLDDHQRQASRATREAEEEAEFVRGLDGARRRASVGGGPPTASSHARLHNRGSASSMPTDDAVEMVYVLCRRCRCARCFPRNHQGG